MLVRYLNRLLDGTFGIRYLAIWLKNVQQSRAWFHVDLLLAFGMLIWVLLVLEMACCFAHLVL